MLAPVGGDLPGQVGQQCLAAGDGDMAAPLPRQVGDLRAHPVHVGDLVADMVDQQLAGAV